MNKNKNQVINGKNILVSNEVRKKLNLIRQKSELPNISIIIEMLLNSFTDEEIIKKLESYLNSDEKNNNTNEKVKNKETKHL